MKDSSKFSSVLIITALALIILFMETTIAVAASPTYITTNSDGTTVWSKASSTDSTKICVLDKGEYVTIVSTIINSKNNKWGKTVNDTWIYMGNLASSNKSAGSTGYYKAKNADVPLRLVPSSSGKVYKNMAKGEAIEITSTYFNDRGNPWGTGNYNDSTYVVYMNNLEKAPSFSPPIYAPPAPEPWVCPHASYNSEGYCNNCGAEFELKLTNITATMYAIKDGTIVRTRPYGVESTVHSTIKAGNAVNVAASAYNSQGNLWYKLSNGTWIYSENLTDVSPACKHPSYTSSGYCAECGAEFELSLTKLTATMYAIEDGTIVRRRPYGVKSTEHSTIKAGSEVNIVASAYNSQGNLWYKLSNNTWIYSENLMDVNTACKHPSYTSAGYCAECGAEFELALKKLSATMYAIEDGTIIRSRPYGIKSTERSTVNAGSAVDVIASAYNSQDNLWYKLSNGTWVYSENLTDVSPDCEHPSYTSAGYCTECGAEFELSLTNLTATMYAIEDGTKVRTRPYGIKSTEHSTIKAGSKVNIVASAYNSQNNLWYKLSDDKWVYSRNLEVHEHLYSGGICSCGDEYPLHIETFTVPTHYVTTRIDVPVWSRPYSKNSTQEYIIHDSGTNVSIVAKTENFDGNLWYKTADGYWIYSKNLTLLPPQAPTIRIESNSIKPDGRTTLKWSRIDDAIYYNVIIKSGKKEVRNIKTQSTSYVISGLLENEYTIYLFSEGNFATSNASNYIMLTVSADVDEGWLWPVPSHNTIKSISSRYGEKRETGTHKGIDIATRAGVPVLATRTGTVERMRAAGKNGSERNTCYIVLKHEYDNKTYYSRYWHLESGSILYYDGPNANQEIKVGDMILQGEQIGITGNTGLSTGRHLHFGISETIDSEKLLINTNPDELYEKYKGFVY